MTRPNLDQYWIQRVFIALVLLFSFSHAAVAKTELTKVRVGQAEDKTRVVFEIKQNHRFEISRLSNPARIVVDFYKADNQLSFKKHKFLDPRLERIRVKDQKNRVRIVLDLRKEFDHHYFVLGKNSKGAERVVIDLTNQTYAKKPSEKSTKKSSTLTKNTPQLEKASRMLASNKPAKSSVMPGVKKELKRNQQTQDVLNAGSPKFKTKGRELVVAIDAGHGGKDTGAIGPGHLYEKNVVLALAKKLKRDIDAQPGMRAVLTRDSDRFIPLHERVRIAHKKEADIFLSLHADAFPNKSVSGGSVYVLSTRGASSVMARVLAKSENASLHDIKLKGRDADVAFVLSDLTREANIRASRKLARAVLGEMGQSVKLHRKTVQSANFAVLKSIDMPSLLIETAFISNPREARKLKSSHFQAKMSKSIVQGLSKFVKQNREEPRWGETLYVHYRVQSGDTLSEIAANYNISTQQLKKLNRIKKADRLKVGQKLRIPVSEKLIASL